MQAGLHKIHQLESLPRTSVNPFCQHDLGKPLKKSRHNCELRRAKISPTRLVQGITHLMVVFTIDTTENFFFY